MKLLNVKSLNIPEIKIIKFTRFVDDRGYFSSHHAKSVLGLRIEQTNESFSRSNVVRGLHFQWNPFQGKLVRTLSGHMIDMVLDIRLGSPNYGKIILYSMPQSLENNFSEWIWVPPGFAHGNFFLKESLIEYFCTGEWAPNSEESISPLCSSIDWSICDTDLKRLFDQMLSQAIITDKDKNGLSLDEWTADERSGNFVYETLMERQEILVV